MGPVVKVLAGLTGIGGVVGAGFGGVYFNSLEKIGNKLGDAVLGIDKEFDESWKAQFKKLSSDSGDLTLGLKKVKDTTGDKNWESLRTWCSNTYNQTYKDMFNDKNEKLLSEAKKYCIQSIREKITEDKFIDKDSGNRQTTFTTKYDALNNHKDTDGELDVALKALKEGYSKDSNKSKWTELETWCKSNYSKPFKGEKENTFKLVRKYCTKD